MEKKFYGNKIQGYSGKIIAVPGEDVTVLSCPFCGNREIEIWNTHSPNYSVSCETCRAEVPSDDDINDGKPIKSRSLAIETHEKALRSAVSNWNKRI